MAGQYLKVTGEIGADGLFAIRSFPINVVREDTLFICTPHSIIEKRHLGQVLDYPNSVVYVVYCHVEEVSTAEQAVREKALAQANEWLARAEAIYKGLNNSTPEE
ncbi:MAG: hypothetical protein FOGNACKC_00862 [Anaerolineae bacterium]|nr:hypothetical protein [Anaerolineae bacterium]